MQPLRDPSEKPSNHADNWVSPLFAKTHTSKSSYVPPSSTGKWLVFHWFLSKLNGSLEKTPNSCLKMLFEIIKFWSFSKAVGHSSARFACMTCCKKGAINLIRRYPHRFFIEFHRIFGFFVPNRLGLVEIYPKGVFNFFFKFFFEVEIWRQSRNFRILQQIFKYFFRRIFGNLKVLDRD